jgi:membrane protein YdbS with pleckstrin-like domain
MVDTSPTNASPPAGMIAPSAPAPPDSAATSETGPQFHSLDPRIVRVWRLSSSIGCGVALLALLAGGAVLSMALPEALPWFAVAWLALALLCAWLVYSYPPRLYRSWGYRVDERTLEIRRGRMFQITKLLPLSRLQHVDLHRGPLERANGLASLVLHTAGTREATLRVPGLADYEAVQLRDHLVAVGGDDAV